MRSIPVVSLALPLLPLILGSGSGCSTEKTTGPAGPILPAAWAGVWLVDGQLLDCDSGGVVDHPPATNEIFCAGEAISFDFLDTLGFALECAGTVTDGAFDLECEDVFAPEDAPDCTVTVRVTLTGTRTGDTFAATGRITTTSEEAVPGACVDYLPICFDIVLDGTRTAGITNECG